MSWTGKCVTCIVNDAPRWGVCVTCAKGGKEARDALFTLRKKPPEGDCQA